MNERVSCVVVTYNRLDLLKENLQHLFDQTTPVNDFFIINNHSDDGTREYLASIDRSNFHVFNSSDNLGGAGGFTLGIKMALTQSDNDLVWLMDDDTMPTPNALSELVKAAESVDNQFGFLSSNVTLMDGTPNNVPTTLFNGWASQLNKNLIQVQSASFVSLLLSRQAVEKVGLPLHEFFIWFDDVEFTGRIAKAFPSYFVKASKIQHKTKGTKEPDLVTDDDRIPRYYYYFRNKLYVEREFDGTKGVVRELFRDFKLLIKLISTPNAHKGAKIKIWLEGVSAGLKFNPQPEQISD